MRISDWSSDVCSSDLFGALVGQDGEVLVLHLPDIQDGASMTFGGQSPDMLAIRLRGPCRVGGGRERFEVGEDAALPFGCGRGAAILPAAGQAQAVEHAARLLGRLTDALGHAPAGSDTAPRGAHPSG